MYIALVNLKQLCEEQNLNKLAMKKLGKHDELEWIKIRSMLRYIFRGTNVEIIICTSIKYTEEEKETILKQCHDSKLGGHLGINKTIKRIQAQFKWKGMKNDVKKYVKNCTSCQVNKVTNRHVKQPMAITSTSSNAFEKIFLDIVGV